MNIIVTGGAGFIGSNFIFHMLKNTRTTASSVWTALPMQVIFLLWHRLWTTQTSVL